MNKTEFLNYTTKNTEIITAALLAGRSGTTVSDEEIDEAVDLSIRIQMRTLARINNMPAGTRFNLINKDGETGANVGKQWNEYNI